MDNSYFVAEIMKGRRRKALLIELEGRETIEEVVKRNYGEDTVVVQYRVPTMEEMILMKRGMIT